MKGGAEDGGGIEGSGWTAPGPFRGMVIRAEHQPAEMLGRRGSVNCQPPHTPHLWSYRKKSLVPGPIGSHAIRTLPQASGPALTQKQGGLGAP